MFGDHRIRGSLGRISADSKVSGGSDQCSHIRHVSDQWLITRLVKS